MGLREKVAEALISDTDDFFIYWDYQTGWKCSGGGCDSLEKEPIRQKGMLGLLDIVQDDDREICSLFLDRMQQGSKDANVFQPLPGKRFEVNLHLRNVDNTYTYYRIECHILKEEETGIMHRGVVEIMPLTQEEIYRLRLAENITNDKNPQYFAGGAAEIMASQPEKRFALIQFDVAKFKVINEQYGEDVGDEILRFFIHTLKIILRPDQLYARLTADVFMVLTSYTQEEEVYELIGKIDQNLSGYKGIPYTLFFGVCEVKDRSQKLRKYGDGAAFARQSIKGDALNHIAFYRDDMKQQAKTQKIVEDQMEHALENHEFVMFLQPKYSISRNRIVGAEALVRWIHPERGTIPPNDFVPLFEKNGFVIKMDQYIWEEACKTIRGWMDAGVEPIPISVNVSRRHLKDGRFVQVLDDLVEKYSIERRYLEIEITETVDQGQTQAGIDLLKEHGYTLLMDDFGSGYSSLNTLKDTQFDVIKIDRYFLQDFVRSERGQKIVEHTIRMTRAIGLELVAEGVENQEQALFLSRCGCDTAQGYYYAKPMPVEQFNERLKE
ncbi:MAG: GGDEF domain-containing phosphodiesterase [Eubacteriales bacterium]|nr:GGDEF domain-containing phosphodiesterase [Eubacteriales bacterium]